MWLRPTHLWLVCFWLLVLSGCSATGEHFGVLRPPSADEARFTFYRPDRLRGVNATPVVQVDDKEVGKLRNAGWISTIVRPGSYMVTIDSGPGKGKVSTRVEAGAGESIVFRVSPGSVHLNIPLYLFFVPWWFPPTNASQNDPWHPQRVGQEVAVEDLKGLRQSE